MSNTNHILRPGRRSATRPERVAAQVAASSVTQKAAAANTPVQKYYQLLNCFAAVPRGAEELAGAELGHQRGQHHH